MKQCSPAFSVLGMFQVRLAASQADWAQELAGLQDRFGVWSIWGEGLGTEFPFFLTGNSANRTTPKT